jgi:hypothetical protein
MQQLPLYPFNPSNSLLRYSFSSPGPPPVKLYVIYEPIEKQNDQIIYNLAFGPADHHGKIDDSKVLNLGDTNVILATVANSCIQFLTNHPKALVFFKGSDERRTNLYVRNIRRYYAEITEQFILLGLVKDSEEWEIFVDTNHYAALIISLK